MNASFSFTDQFHCLIGQVRLDWFGRGFRHGTSTDHQSGVLILIGTLLFAIGAIWFLSWLKERKQKPGREFHPRKLFWELCLAHQLRWKDRLLLRRVASQQKLSSPGLLFLHPECLKKAANNHRFRKNRLQLKTLQTMLFEGLEQKPSSS